MEITKESEQVEMTQKEVQENQEYEAKSRQLYDPCEKPYDSRRRRVTALKECARVTFPRPLGPEQEALMETRRNTQREIFNKYIRKNTDKNGY